MRFLSDKTLIPLGVAILGIGGAAMWLTSLYFQTQANASQIQRLADKQDSYLSTLIEIRSDVAVIKSKFEETKK
jgi:hypothetical protein